MNADLEAILLKTNEKFEAAAANSPKLDATFWIENLLTAFILIMAIFILRYSLLRVVKGKSEILHKDQRKWINRINNLTTALVVLSVIMIWAPQLQTFALSLTAVAVAVVLITKELIMCLIGGLVRATTKPFEIGDWITLDGLTGEVMRITPFATLIEEVDMVSKTYQFTGRTVQIPNSKFLVSHIENANFIKKFVYQDVVISVQYADLNPSKLVDKLHEIADQYYAPFHDESAKFNRKVEKKAAVDFPDPKPQIFMKTTDIGHNIYTVRMLVPTHSAASVSTNITKDFLTFVHLEKEKKKP